MKKDITFRCIKKYVSGESSGITKDKDNRLIVSDNQPGLYHSFKIIDIQKSYELDDTNIIMLDNAKYAYDLEAIDVLADSRPVVLS